MKYIEEKIVQMNADLWEIVKQRLRESGYIIDEKERTATLPAGEESPHLFYYWTGSQSRPYKGLKKYGAGNDFKPASGRVALTSPIGRGAIHNIECADMGSITTTANMPPCQIGFYTVEVESTTYTIFVGKTETGQPLTDKECRRIMFLPVVEFEEQDKKSAAWLRVSTGGTMFHELDRFIDTETFIQRQLENRTSAQNEEIARMREANNRKKADLERNLNAVRAELKTAQGKTDKGLSRLEIMRVERETTLLIKRIKDIEKSLHYDKMKLEQELKAEVEAFLGKSKLTARLYRQFILNVKGAE